MRWKPASLTATYTRNGAYGHPFSSVDDQGPGITERTFGSIASGEALGGDSVATGRESGYRSLAPRMVYK